MATKFSRLSIGDYLATEEFKSIGIHTCVCNSENGALIAVTGPVNDRASIDYARLFAAGPEMLAALDTADTALAVININRNHYDLVPQAAEALREAWAAVNAAMAKARGTVDKFAEANG